MARADGWRSFAPDGDGGQEGGFKFAQSSDNTTVGSINYAHTGDAAMRGSVAEGDFNGDGQGDFAVSGYNGRDMPNEYDDIWIYEGPLRGGSSGYVEHDAALVANESLWDAHIGEVVSTVGDMNFDGYDDILAAREPAADGAAAGVVLLVGLGAPYCAAPVWTDTGTIHPSAPPLSPSLLHRAGIAFTGVQ